MTYNQVFAEINKHVNRQIHINLFIYLIIDINILKRVYIIILLFI